jgi:hypothetical protein
VSSPLQVTISVVLQLPHLPAACPCAAPADYYYTSKVSAATFVWNPAKLEQAEAQLACNDLGGHLAVFTSLAEQVDVENYYINWGLMFPTYTPSYWMGAESAFDLWPSFFWAQRNFTGPTDGKSYNHFGADEPNNLAYTEYCTVANYTLNYQGANGWSDTACNNRFPYMCRLSGGYRPRGVCQCCLLPGCLLLH